MFIEDVDLPADVEDVRRSVGEIEQRVAAHIDRVSWAPIAANAAAILALTGIIGNVDRPDDALSALSSPLSIFGLGVLAGLAASHAQIDALRASSSASRSIADGMARMRPLLELAKNFGQRLASATNDDERAQLDRDREGARQKIQHLRAELEKAEAKLRRWDRANVASQILSWGSVALCAGGMATLIIGHRVGSIVLQPPQLAAAGADRTTNENTQLSPNRVREVQNQDTK